jgi:hypothetical protein
VSVRLPIWPGKRLSAAAESEDSQPNGVAELRENVLDGQPVESLLVTVTVQATLDPAHTLGLRGASDS